jgi:hypothetical protein
MYETWLRLQWPKVEWATGRIDIAHATTLIPCPTDAPLVVTLHDLAFVHTPRFFTKHGVRVFRRSVHHIKERADLVLCCSQATMDDCVVRTASTATAAPGAPRRGGRAGRRRGWRRVPRAGCHRRVPVFVGTVEPQEPQRASSRLEPPDCTPAGGGRRPAGATPAATHPG